MWFICFVKGKLRLFDFVFFVFDVFMYNWVIFMYNYFFSYGMSVFFGDVEVFSVCG